MTLRQFTRRGRPRSPARADLASALRERQDSQARRTARQIRDLEQQHIVAREASAAWTAEAARVTTRLRQLPGALAAAISAGDDPPTVERVVRSAVHQVLRDLAGSGATGRAKTRRPPQLRPSASLASARARGARLQARLVDAREAIARGELVSVADVERDLAARVSAARSKLLAWPVTLPDMLCRAAILEGRPAVEQLVSEAVTEAVAELTDDRPTAKRSTKHGGPTT